MGDPFLNLCVLLALLQALDLYLTTLAIEAGGSEWNKVSAWLIDRLGSVWLGGGLVKALLTAAVYATGVQRLAEYAVVLMFAVLWHNWVDIRRLRARRAG